MLTFRFPPAKTEYGLQLIASTRLQQGFVEPGEEVTLQVTNEAWTLQEQIFKHYDVNPDLAEVTFTLGRVQFKDAQWSKGLMLRPSS